MAERSWQGERHHGDDAVGASGGRAPLLDRGITAPATPAARVVAVIAILLIALVLVYEAEVTSRGGAARSWATALALSGLLVARGVYLRRPITYPHITVAVLVLAIASIAYRIHHPGVGFALLAATGFVLVLPQRAGSQPYRIDRVAELVGRTEGDPLAPFAMHSAKAYFFDRRSTAAIGYRTRFGVAVVGGDPVGDRAAFPDLISAFSEFAAGRGWRIAVLGASPGLAELWQVRAGRHRGLYPVPIGNDVVIDVDRFDLSGRKFRNLRQAVNHTVNAGVGTEVRYESSLTAARRAELLAIVDQWRRGRQVRGFSMILDHLLDGRHPNMLVVIADGMDGRAVGFQRYGISGKGKELSLDVPWRRRDAYNGVNERMIVDLVDYARGHGIHRIALAFAPFPELFARRNTSRGARVARLLAHLGDPLIRLESLYRFLCKFHALSEQRYVLIRRREIVVAAAALLALEFVPRHREH
ncbi:bifunctional lysylphosphatidylglycerol flippase/synthetase MprF [Nocardia grenadensis]|uniref:bifunctional lysylphosphatidylglycerol flippase/synthetase MprF n=1 Tax=Nocardia grenadensis TaxID=931537 RepID=UPI000A06EE26|nr:phosphatidylglycerol lysyltransferase domain-containing protein [Nocardia grenadensis]